MTLCVWCHDVTRNGLLLCERCEGWAIQMREKRGEPLRLPGSVANALNDVVVLVP